MERKDLKSPTTIFQFLEAFYDGEHGEEQFISSLKKINITLEEFRDPRAKIDGNQIYSILQDITSLNEDKHPIPLVLPYFSIYDLGFGGIAGMSGFTINDAMQVAVKYASLINPAFELTQLESQNGVFISPVLKGDFGKFNNLINEAILCALKHLADETVGEKLPLVIQFSHSPDQPDLKAIYQELFKCEIDFNRDKTSIFVSNDVLQKRLKKTNKILHNYANDILDKELEKLEKEQKFSDYVTSILSEAAKNDQYLGLPELADQLHITPRTLSRRLAKEGLQFKNLLNDIKIRNAKLMLKSTDIPLKRLALKLGFSNAESFTRSFRSQTGLTPNQWKQKNLT